MNFENGISNTASQEHEKPIVKSETSLDAPAIETKKNPEFMKKILETEELGRNLLLELDIPGFDAVKVKSDLDRLKSKILSIRYDVNSIMSEFEDEAQSLRSLGQETQSKAKILFRKFFEMEIIDTFRDHVEPTLDQIKAEANYQGDNTELMLRRLDDPIIREKLARLIYIDRKYDLNQLDVLSIQEVESKLEDTIKAVAVYTPVTFTGEMPSSVALDDGRENLDVVWKLPEIFGSDGIGQKNIIEAHEKGHTIRKIQSDAALAYFGKGFDFNSVSKNIPTERLENIVEYLHSLDPESPMPTQDEAKEGIADYLSNPMELIERMSQLKNYFGMGNETIFTAQHLQYARDHYIQDTGVNNCMAEFFLAITPETEAEFLRIINNSGI